MKPAPAGGRGEGDSGVTRAGHGGVCGRGGAEAVSILTVNEWEAHLDRVYDSVFDDQSLSGRRGSAQ
jgi:hypothetical protein